MAGLLNVSPGVSVNKGLATTYKPMYPEQAQLLAQKQSADTENAKLRAAQRKADKEYALKMEMDVDGLDRQTTDRLMKKYSGIQTDYAAAGAQGMNPSNDPVYTERWTELATETAAAKASEKQAREMIAQAKEGGSMDYLDQASVARMVQEEKAAADAEGRMRNFDHISDSRDAYARERLGDGFINKYDRGAKTYLQNQTLEGRDLSVTMQYTDGDFYEREDPGPDGKPGKIIMVTTNAETGERMPLLKSAAPDAMLEDLYTNPENVRYLEALQRDAEQKGTSVADELYNDMARNKGGQTAHAIRTSNAPRDPSDDPSSGQEAEQRDADFLYNTTMALASDDPAERATALNGLRSKNLDFRENANGTITPIISRQFIETTNFDEQRRILQMSRTLPQETKRKLRDMNEAEIQELIDNEFKNKNIELTALDDKDYEQVVEMANMAGAIKYRNAVYIARNRLQREGHLERENDFSEDPNAKKESPKRGLGSAPPGMGVEGFNLN